MVIGRSHRESWKSIDKHDSLNNRTSQREQKDEILNTKNENVELVTKVDQLLELDVEENLKLVEKLKLDRKTQRQFEFQTETRVVWLFTLQRASHSREFFSKTVDKFKSYC